ncbi:helix-turn-helix transcriptional regulator [Alteromonas sp. NFXS44]|uniref:helix-turn-helix domain-containing protein n=1 Tax=Alteromonas sp. NFXS44 TaxID=2818435 RepID=UPI0032DF775E
MSIGENVKALRLRAGLTQSQLANAAGIQLTQISRIENNDTDPKASTLDKVILALGCTANDIFNKPSGEKMSLEDFIGAIDYRSGMDMRTAVVLWKQLNDHQQFIKQVSETYKNDSDPQGDLVKRIQATEAK